MRNSPVIVNAVPPMNEANTKAATNNEERQAGEVEGAGLALSESPARWLTSHHR